jgi:hypothetical protein
MKLATYFGITGAIGVLFGLAFLLAPGISLSQYAIPTDAYNLMQARYFGSALLAFALIVWLARGTREELAQRALLQATVVGDLVGMVLSIWAVVSGLQNAMAWSSVVIYGVFALGAIYFLAFPARRG